MRWCRYILAQSVSVKGKPVGRTMYKAMQKSEVPPMPIEFDFKECRERKLVKQLVGAMLHPDPEKRPDIGDVLKELKDIAGIYYCWY